MAATAVRGVFTANLKIRRKPHQGGWVRRSRTFAAACGSGKNKTVGFVQPPSDRQMNLTPKPLHSPPLIIDGLPAAKQLPLQEKASRRHKVHPRPQYAAGIYHTAKPYFIVLCTISYSVRHISFIYCSCVSAVS